MVCCELRVTTDSTYQVQNPPTLQVDHSLTLKVCIHLSWLRHRRPCAGFDNIKRGTDRHLS